MNQFLRGGAWALLGWMSVWAGAVANNPGTGTVYRPPVSLPVAPPRASEKLDPLGENPLYVQPDGVTGGCQIAVSTLPIPRPTSRAYVNLGPPMAYNRFVPDEIRVLSPQQFVSDPALNFSGKLAQHPYYPQFVGGANAYYASQPSLEKSANAKLEELLQESAHHYAQALNSMTPQESGEMYRIHSLVRQNVTRGMAAPDAVSQNLAEQYDNSRVLSFDHKKALIEFELVRAMRDRLATAPSGQSARDFMDEFSRDAHKIRLNEAMIDEKVRNLGTVIFGVPLSAAAGGVGAAVVTAAGVQTLKAMGKLEHLTMMSSVLHSNLTGLTIGLGVGIWRAVQERRHGPERALQKATEELKKDYPALTP